MDSSLFKALIDPAILFFFFGLFAGVIRSNLTVPEPIAKFMSLYLLVAVGFKGGAEMAHSGLSMTMGMALLAAASLALIIPAYTFVILRRKLNPFDAAAIAATYGSVSAVTFITAASFIERQGIHYGGYMTVALVMMESPAIIMAVLLANLVRARNQTVAPDAPQASLSLKSVLHEAFTDGAHLLLLASLLIGFITGGPGKAALDPFLTSIQKGMLLFFLLDMGLLVARKARDFKLHGPFLMGFALLIPMINAGLAMLVAKVFGLALGDAFLLMVLAASSSYIVVPAVVRYAIPEANAGLYFGMSLAITFPFNILIGIPLYYSVLNLLWRA